MEIYIIDVTQKGCNVPASGLLQTKRNLIALNAFKLRFVCN